MHAGKFQLLASHAGAARTGLPAHANATPYEYMHRPPAAVVCTMWQLPLLAALACRADSSNSSSRAGDTPLADDWGIQCTPAVVLAAKESVPVFQCGDKV